METNSGFSRNIRLDFLKVICCILVVILHSPAMCGEIAEAFMKALTAIAVPCFMATSGYLILYRKEYTIRKVYGEFIVKYGVIFLLWDFIYIVYGYMMTDRSMSFVSFAATNSEGWHLWYLKAYIQILLVYPIIRAITKEEKLCILFSSIWCVMIPLKYSMATYLGIDWIYLRLIQFPFFQFSGVVSGTTMGYYPMECLGYFILGGLLIDRLEKRDKKTKFEIFMLFVGIIGLCITLGMHGYTELAYQPLQINVLFMMCAFITAIYYLDIKNFQIGRVITWLSDKTLGVYIIQGFTLRIAKYIVSKTACRGYTGNIMIFLFTIVISFCAVAFIHRILPKKIYQYIL